MTDTSDLARQLGDALGDGFVVERALGEGGFAVVFLVRDIALSIQDVNYEPALVLRVGERLESIFVFTVEDDLISGIRVVRNPEKLAHIDRQLSP